MFSRGLEAIFCYVTDFCDCEERQMSTNYNQMPPPVPADRPANFGKNNLGRFLLFLVVLRQWTQVMQKKNSLCMTLSLCTCCMQPILVGLLHSQHRHGCAPVVESFNYGTNKSLLHVKEDPMKMSHFYQPRSGMVLGWLMSGIFHSVDLLLPIFPNHPNQCCLFNTFAAIAYYKLPDFKFGLFLPQS